MQQVRLRIIEYVIWKKALTIFFGYYVIPWRYHRLHSLLELSSWRGNDQWICPLQTLSLWLKPNEEGIEVKRYE